MGFFDFTDLVDWRKWGECYPFEDSLGNLCISVESEYESFGGEKDARLLEAKEYGIDRLIRFYGKMYISDATSANIVRLPTPTKLYDAASTPDYYINPRLCVRMKVLVKIPKDTFDENTADDATCDINKPSEGYLSAFISVENYERDIEYITNSMEDFLPKMAKSDKYMTNINIVKEIERLRSSKNVIRRYFNLNSVAQSSPATDLSDSGGAFSEECEVDKQSNTMEIGFSYDYKPAFTLIDGNQHTIGYDCFLENSLLNHPTTANYLIQLGNMSSALTGQQSLDFDIFQFLSQHTYPAPIIETKKNSLDGLEKYDANGNLFSFANLAKLITLDLDKKSCKDTVEVEEENRVLWDAQTSRNIADTARQSREFIGNWKFSTKGFQDLKETGSSMLDAVKDPPEALKNIMSDIADAADWGCVLEETLQCMLEESITLFGTTVFDDPDLGQFFSVGDIVEIGACTPPNDCNDKLQLKVGLKAFKGITIPSDFPTTDYLSKTLDDALKKLYNTLINSLVSLFLSLLDNMCKMVSSVTDLPAIKSIFEDGFTSWLSKTIGVDISELEDGDAWASAALSIGGTGFMGVIGNFVSRIAGSMDSSGNWVWGGSVTSVYSGTGMPISLPNPNTGMVEEFFVSIELISEIISGIRKATEDLEVVLTPEEYRSLSKGAAPDDVLDMASECLRRANPEMFQSREDVSDLFSYLGKMVEGSLLENPLATETTVTNVCDLGDGSDQDILRKNFLTSKDPLLSDSEVEELLSREKSRFVGRVVKAHKSLKSFRDGSIFPNFPSLFGLDDSLVPELPPIIDDAMKSAAQGMYKSSINNLNSVMNVYPDVWGTVFKNKVEETSVNLDDLYNDSKPYFSVDDDGDKIVMGYGLPSTPETIPSQQYIEPLEGSTMENGWWFLHRGGGDGIDIGDYTSQVTAGSEEPEKTAFLEMIALLGFEKAYDHSDRADILREIHYAQERLRELIARDWYIGEFFKDVFGDTWNFLFDKLNWDDLYAFLKKANTMKEVVESILSQMGITMEQWLDFDFECLEEIWDDKDIVWEWVNKKGKTKTNKLNSFGDFDNFALIVEQYFVVDDLYWRAKAALVVMDIADYLEDWDDANDNNFIDMDEDIEWEKGKRSKMVKPLPEYIDGSFDDDTEIGKVTLTYNITDVISLAKKEEFAAAQGISDVNDLSVTAFITFKKEFVGKNSYYVKASLQYDTAEVGVGVETKAVRSGNWTKTLTTLERMGARRLLTSASNRDFGDRGSILAGIRDALASGGSEDYDILPNNKITTIVGNYKMANDFMVSLGKKEAKSDLLEEKYSFNTDNTSHTLSSWWSGLDTQTTTTAVTAGQYGKLVIDAGGSGDGDYYTLDYVYKVYRLLDDMRERVMTSQYRTTGSIGGMIDSYVRNDAMKHKDLTKWAGEHVSEVMRMQQLDEMCDALSPNRRTAASMGVRMLAREFILESALISLQIFDTFNTGFMESEAFRQTIFYNMKTEMKKYSDSFEDTIKNSIFTDIKDAAVKYYEYRSFLGDEVEIESGSKTLISIIGEEITEIRKSIVSALQLSETGTWDDFVLDEILPAATFNVSQGYNGQYYFVNVDTVYTDETVTLFSSQCIGTADEGSKEGGGADICGDAEEIIVSGKYLTVRQQLFDNEEYKEFINNIFPLRELVTQLSVYQSSALSDVAVFSGTHEGRNLFDIFAETKLATLQVLLASLYGAGETTYIDPFLEKLKT
jgi:hypothetical protein